MEAAGFGTMSIVIGSITAAYALIVVGVFADKRSCPPCRGHCDGKQSDRTAGHGTNESVSEGGDGAQESAGKKALELNDRSRGGGDGDGGEGEDQEYGIGIGNNAGRLSSSHKKTQGMYEML